MILESLKVMLFGMLGIFFVMGLIITAIRLLGFFQNSQKNKPEEEDSDA